MTGFKHDPPADVNLIADNLRDRYKDRFSILKELLQNADDACAESIRLAIVAGHPEAFTPPVRTPGLVTVNNGTFNGGRTITRVVVSGCRIFRPLTASCGK